MHEQKVKEIRTPLAFNFRTTQINFRKARSLYGYRALYLKKESNLNRVEKRAPKQISAVHCKISPEGNSFLFIAKRKEFFQERYIVWQLEKGTFFHKIRKWSFSTQLTQLEFSISIQDFLEPIILLLPRLYLLTIFSLQSYTYTRERLNGWLIDLLLRVLVSKKFLKFCELDVLPFMMDEDCSRSCLQNLQKLNKSLRRFCFRILLKSRLTMLSDFPEIVQKLTGLELMHYSGVNEIRNKMFQDPFYPQKIMSLNFSSVNDNFTFLDMGIIIKNLIRVNAKIEYFALLSPSYYISRYERDILESNIFENLRIFIFAYKNKMYYECLDSLLKILIHTSAKNIEYIQIQYWINMRSVRGDWSMFKAGSFPLESFETLLLQSINLKVVQLITPFNGPLATYLDSIFLNRPQVKILYGTMNSFFSLKVCSYPF